ncbi:MAG: family 10 glycosylhydrolase [Hamadaea sp.]|nr:family 10 glycosylhydrolase [Hamadaea sp.]
MRRLTVSVLLAAVVALMASALPATANPAQPRVGGGQSDALAVAAACTPNPATPLRQLRAMWIASVTNIDWPSATGLSAATQQAEFKSWLDLAVRRNLNAVVVQIRPSADAFWPSSYEPWSRYLTGTQGAGPGYDPLAFMVSEAHARNLEFHAWFNPYRVALTTDLTMLTATHPARVHPEWTFAYDGRRYYNPGIPAVRTFVEDAMMDAVTKYDVDGVHWDDYFYPYPVSGVAIPDATTFVQYGGGFSDIGDWRRNNVDLLVQEMSQRIHAAKPWVKFGISPFGIWRNASTDALGSQTSGLQSYDAIYADSRKWVKSGWLDYIAPQIYWHIGFTTADYAVLMPWWADLVAGTNTQLYIGQAAYRVGASGQSAQWQTTTELTNHVTLNRSYAEVDGDIYFSANDVLADRLGSITRLAADHYTRPALLPLSVPGTPPASPATPSGTRVSSGVQLNWTGSGTSYAVYRIAGAGPADACAFTDAANLLTTVRGTAYLDKSAVAGQTYTYYVTALDRLHNQSAPSGGRTVSGGAFSVIVDNTDSGRFTASANWGSSAYSAQRYGADYRFANPQSIADAAWWKADIPATGSYKIAVWYPANSGYNSATPYVVATTTGTVTVTVDQRSNGGTWVNLGTFTLAAGDHNVVGVSRWTTGTGYVIADAVRITAA